ncbi:MAG: PSD1 and planctomycete cytochrome C domain-containing protein [Pirellula sp.]
MARSVRTCFLVYQLAFLSVLIGGASGLADDGLEFFEKRVRPVLVEHCYSCHSAEASELKANLQLDLKSGWRAGGDSGEPAVIPGEPNASPLIQAIRHDEGVSAMPPKKPKLPQSAITDLTTWVRMGAPDPRDGRLTRRNSGTDWETEYQRRLDWWSLKPIQATSPPTVKNELWIRSEVDRFILSKLEVSGLSPTQDADRTTLARRLSFALTGLPADRDVVERFLADESPHAYDGLVTTMLDSPHFGEQWARHWMDVVHYSDTHGYEWDVPAKNAWQYRDYLIRSFNSDVPYRQLVIEQIAGDLVEPRVDPNSRLNEALVGPMMLRLGERRHGDNSAAEGISQEAVSNMIDTLGKAFLGTTIACAQCHDHKLDPVEQRDYYSLAGMLMSSRFSARPVDSFDPNEEIISELRAIKRKIRDELARLWLDAIDKANAAGIRDKFQAIPVDKKLDTAFPTSLAAFWKKSKSEPITSNEFEKEREQRVTANRSQLQLMADFTDEGLVGGWRWEGLGMKHGCVSTGEIVIAGEGEVAVQHLLPAGRFSHVWSQRLAGSLQSPQFDTATPVTFSMEIASGKFSSLSFVVDRALNPERLTFPNSPLPAWKTLTAGNFDSLEGTVDNAPRRVYLELATKSLNNYFPPRVGYGGLTEAETADARSWFGVTRVYQHAPGKAPLDELDRFSPLFDTFQNEADWTKRLLLLVQAAVKRWSEGTCSDEDVRLMNEALQLKLLPNERTGSPELDRLVHDFRITEKKIQSDQTVGSIADWNEGRDDRVGVRGSYSDLGAAVPRGKVRFLIANSQLPALSSGRLEWANRIVDPSNPLTARVYVNRVWHYLFGAGLVRTPDDFGHLGDQPTHPELLDYLASRFVHEGWSTKKLIRLLVTSSVWRQSSVPNSRSLETDPENRSWHHFPMRRLEAEEIRDSILWASGRLDRSLFGLPVEPFRTAEDSQKRLMKGPVDGDGRRSIYLKMTLMEPPRFLALFNQPIPKQTVGRRDLTNVPDQALALLNDPFVVAMAKHWSKRLVADDVSMAGERVEQMLTTALGRPSQPDEIAGLVELAHRCAELRGQESKFLSNEAAWQDAAHAVFNLKEFLYVR